MAVDFSKMTPELYEEILITREAINSSRKELALLEVELKNFDDNKRIVKMIESIQELKKEINKLEIWLTPYEF